MGGAGAPVPSAPASPCRRWSAPSLQAGGGFPIKRASGRHVDRVSAGLDPRIVKIWLLRRAGMSIAKIHKETGLARRQSTSIWVTAKYRNGLSGDGFRASWIHSWITLENAAPPCPRVPACRERSLHPPSPVALTPAPAWTLASTCPQARLATAACRSDRFREPRPCSRVPGYFLLGGGEVAGVRYKALGLYVDGSGHSIGDVLECL